MPGSTRAPSAPAGSYGLAQQSSRYFLWGFDGGPSAMTQDGQELFVNVAWSLLEYDPVVDTLILVDYQRMEDIGYAATDVYTLETKIDALIALPRLQSNMNAVVKRMGLNTPTYVQSARTTWIGDDNSVANTNGYVDAIDTYIESLKLYSFPNLQYVIFVGAHEVIPQKARPADDMDSHKESNWASGLPQTSGYFYSLYHDTSGGATRGHYLTDSKYGDLSYINNGYGADDELIPELAVGRLVETPAQMVTLIDNYIASEGVLVRVDVAAIGANDYVDGALMAANYLGWSTDTSLARNTFSSTEVPLVINDHNDMVYIGGHGNYNHMDPGFKAGTHGTAGDTEELNIMPNAVVVASGCHNGVNLGNMRYHDYTNSTTYGDFPERFAARQVGIYLGSTGYTWITGNYNDGSDCNDPACTGASELLAVYFLKHLIQDDNATAGLAFKAAVNEYVGYYSDFGDPVNAHRRVLSIATLYGIPNYHWPEEWRIPWDKIYIYREWLNPLDPVTVSPLERVTMHVQNWSVDPSGFLDLASLPIAGAANEPALPKAQVGHVLPPDSSISGVVWDAGASVSETIDHDLPLIDMAILSQTVPNSFSYDGFYPPTPFFTRTLSAPGGAGWEANLTIVPVQYNPTTHQTRIWRTMVFSVEYTVDAYGLVSDGDGDGLPDYWESGHGLSPTDATGDHGATGDPDGDDLTNTQEHDLGTHPLEADTDRDGQDDGTEVANGTDPLNPGSRARWVYLPVLMRQ
jgi:hypothetical protein